MRTWHKWGQELTLSTGRTLTLEPRAGCLVELTGTVGANGQWVVLFGTDGGACYGGLATGKRIMSSCVPLLPARDQFSPDPAERIAEAWELLRMIEVSREYRYPADKGNLWLYRHGDADDQIDVATITATRDWPNSLHVRFDAEQLTDPAVLRTAANRLEALQAWLASLAGEEQA